MQSPPRRASRFFLLPALLIVVALVVVVAFVQPFDDGDESPTRKRAPRGAPNILIIVTDDQRTDSMEAMPKTSKYFIEEGTWFPNGFSTTPVCCPARASIFSGRFVHNHGVENFTPYELDQETTLQARLQDNEYRTAFYGKYLNAWSREDNPPFFDDWANFPQSNEMTYAGDEYNVNGDIVNGGMYSTDFLRERAFRFLEQGESEGDSRPWLMYLSTPAAHLPFVAEPRFADAPVGRWKGNDAVFETDLSDKPRHVRQPYKGKCDFKCGRNIRAQQHRTLMSVDVMVDEVMKKLEELGQADNTLAIFVSDNGSMWGDHGLGNKRFPYTPSSNVPFGMRWPAEIEPGVDKRIVSIVDIAPTVMDGAKVDSDIGTEMDGRSLLDNWRRKEMLLEHWHSKTVPAYGSLWSTDYQYIEYYNKNQNRVIFREYFDLKKDPWQLENLLAPGSQGRPGEGELQTLSDRLARFRACEGAGCP